MKILRIILCCLASATTAWGQVEKPRGLTSPLAKLDVAGKSFEEALRELALRSRHDVVLAFEPASSAELKAPKIPAALDSGTVGDVLALMCAVDKRYSYSEVRPGVIEVRSAEEAPAVRTLMNLPIPATDIKVRDWPFNLFGRIQELIPALGDYLRAKAAEQSSGTGRPAPGTPGITLMTSVPPPLIVLHIPSTTVRGALDAFAAYTLDHGSKNRADSPYLPPVGWRVDFTADPQAPTGLGGYIKWSAFP